jgi:hypothetical protein
MENRGTRRDGGYKRSVILRGLQVVHQVRLLGGLEGRAIEPLWEQ